MPSLDGSNAPLLLDVEVAGVPVRMERGHSFYAFAFIGAGAALPLANVALGLGSILTVFAAIPVVLLLSVLAHETGHAVAARHLGVEIEEVRLVSNGGGVVATHAKAPRDQAVIYAAGPLTTLMLLAAAALLAQLCGWPPGTYGPAAGTNLVGWDAVEVLRGVLATVVVVNLFGLLVTAVPAASNDAGQLLALALRRARVGDVRVVLIGSVCALVLSVALLAASVWAAIEHHDAAALLLPMAAVVFLGDIPVRDRLRMALLGDVPLRRLRSGQQLAWPPTARVDRVLHVMVAHLPEEQRRMAVLDDAGGFAGFVDPADLQGLPAEAPVATALERRVQPAGLAVLPGAATLSDVAARVPSSDALADMPWALVDEHGRFEGRISDEDVWHCLLAVARDRGRASWQRRLLLGSGAEPDCRPVLVTVLQGADEPPACDHEPASSS